MKILKTIVALGLAAIFAVASVMPSSAARIYNADTNKWEDADEVRSRARGGSRIPKKLIDFESKYRPGTIIVETSERRLYFIMEDDKAMVYGIGVGRDGFRWAGTHRITRKAEWPSWTPPAAMRKRVPGLPAFMPGGPDNPMGARALYIGSTLYRLHGTSEPWTIGHAVSSGCIRLTNADITDLYERVKVGSRVIVRR